MDVVILNERLAIFSFVISAVFTVRLFFFPLSLAFYPSNNIRRWWRSDTSYLDFPITKVGRCIWTPGERLFFLRVIIPIIIIHTKIMIPVFHILGMHIIQYRDRIANDFVRVFLKDILLKCSKSWACAYSYSEDTRFSQNHQRIILPLHLCWQCVCYHLWYYTGKFSLWW